MIIYCVPGAFKKRSVWDELDKIMLEIKTSTKNPIDRIREIMGDVRHLFYDISRDSIPELENCFEELDHLKPEMELIGGAIYNYYTQMMIAVGECESSMMRVNQTTKTESLFAALDTKFSQLFQLSHKVLAPPIPISITKEQVYQAVHEGAHLEDIAQATAMSDEALRIMLQSQATISSTTLKNYSESLFTMELLMAQSWMCSRTQPTQTTLIN
jgi:hypothetical protein